MLGRALERLEPGFGVHQAVRWKPTPSLGRPGGPDRYGTVNDRGLLPRTNSWRPAQTDPNDAAFAGWPVDEAELYASGVDDLGVSRARMRRLGGARR